MQLDVGRRLGDRALLDAIGQDVLFHCGTVRPKDDMTFMVLTRTPAAVNVDGPGPAPAPPADPATPPAPPAPVSLPRWS